LPFHERESGRVTLARDRFGIKPLYYSEAPGRLRFSSTLPGIVAAGDVDTAIDREALHFYMSWHAVVPPPWTILKGVRKLPPATIRTYEEDGTFSERVYWDPPFGSAETLSKGEWEEQLLAALRTAVERRMVADVPVGVLLSGGVDSSLIVGLLAEMGQHGLSTFSIGFEGAHGESGDEFVYSDLIARHYGTDHHKLFVPSADLLRELPGAIEAMSEPMVSYDNIGFFLLSREVAKHIKVVQSGQGADEVFGGYHWYPPMAGANDPVATYARAFFDRDAATLNAHLGPDWRNGGTGPLDFVRDHFARAGASDPVAKALPDRFHRDAGRRPGEAGRQHDDGVGAGGARSVPRSRSCRAGGEDAFGHQASQRRQGRLEGCCATRDPVGGDRPAEGLLPRARAEIYRRPLSRSRA
jgi:asparagine synthase (glutamine-hydrolysing)